MTTITSVDEWVRQAVTQQLAWEPDLDASMIGLSTRDGIVTLSGFVDTYAATLAAERAAKRAYGVKAIANELEVRQAHGRIDPDIARDVVEAMRLHIHVPPGLSVTVRDGRVTLTGGVDWTFQRVAAEQAARSVRGVRDVFNQTTIRPTLSARDVQKRIAEALHQHGSLDARGIHVEATGGRVTLSGSVRSWRDKDLAFCAAKAAPGVIAVESRIDVVPKSCS
jgi:osmotically-inducible protein OsmY